MARLPDPVLEKMTVKEPYEGVEEDRDKFLSILAKLIHEMNTKKGGDK